MRNRRVLIALIPLATAVVYLAKFRGNLFLGDGYIFLAYARNIASGAGWSINSGEISFATTSPLWTLVLSLIYAITAKHFMLVACLAGALCYSAATWLFARIVPFSTALLFATIPFFGLFYATSAMETGVFLFLFIGFLNLLVSSEASIKSDLVAGGLAGLLFLVRPEGLLCAFGYLLVKRRFQLSSIIAVCGLALLITAPWELFLHHHSGAWLPSSGKGRLYGYFNSVFPDTTLAAYLDKSMVWKFTHIPTVIRTQILMHPVMIAAVLLPLVAIAANFVTEFKRRRYTTIGLFAAFYALGNLAMYLLLQPLLFQRYFVALMPLAMMLWLPRLKMRGMVVAVVAIACVANFVAYGYYATHAQINTRARNVIHEAVATANKPDCRLATEKLGIAAFITKCYIIDTGGLVDPKLWQYWIDGRTDRDYATDQHADVLILSDGAIVRMN